MPRSGRRPRGCVPTLAPPPPLRGAQMMPQLLAKLKEFATNGPVYPPQTLQVGANYRPVAYVTVKRQAAGLPRAWRDEIFFARGSQPLLMLSFVEFRPDVRRHGHCKALIEGAKAIGTRLGYTALVVESVRNKHLRTALRRWGGWSEMPGYYPSFWWVLDPAKAGVRMTRAGVSAFSDGMPCARAGV